MLDVKHIQFAYKGKVNVLKDISLTLSEGECLCLLGPNGTGKSTLLRCLLNLQHVKAGVIMIDGQDLHKLSALQRSKYLAYVSQASNVTFPYTVQEVVQMGRITHLKMGAAMTVSDYQVVNEVLEKLELTAFRNKYFHELSGGERQMVLVARALAQQARYLIMDEPTANLDYANQIKILNTIKNLANDSYGILMTSHFPDHAFLACNKALLMKNGLVMNCGNPETVVNSASLTELYQTPVCVTQTTIDNNQVLQIKKVCVPIM